MRFPVLLGLFLTFAAGGCACMNPRNTPLLTTLDQYVKPETTTTQVLLGPIFVPVGVLTAGIDIVVLHPVQSVQLGARDTYRILWAAEPEKAAPAGQAPPKKSGFVGQALLTGAKAIATPVLFPICWLGESLFALPQPTEEKKE